LNLACRIVEKYGSGIKRIIAGFREYGLPDPEFRESTEGFLVTVYSSVSVPIRQEKSSEKIIVLLSEQPALSARQIAEITPRGVEKQLDKLHQQGLLRRIGPDKGGHWEIVER
jgi:ATP-dependent DNA helicase RecG